MKTTYKRLFILLLSFTMLFFVLPQNEGQAKSFDVDAESAILVDGKTGKILYAKNIDQPLPPASMTKIMTEYIVWDAIENGEIDWDTTTEISDYAYDISANDSFSGVGLKKDKEYTVRELYEAMAINSDNATTIALAELISGSEPNFVKRMNEKAKEIGLPDSNFINASGLDSKDLGKYRPKDLDENATNLLSAKSAALLAYHFINDYPDALEISKIPETKFADQQIRNWNHMLDHDTTYLKQFYYEGVDGLKTGFTELAGYCFTGTAERDGNRLISVVMKADSEKDRFKQTAKLFDYGFDRFETKEIFKKGETVEDKQTIPVEKGKKKQVEIGLEDEISFPIQSGEEESYSLEFTIDKDKLNENGQLTAPVEKGTKVGTAKIIYKDKEDYGYITDTKEGSSIDVVTTEEVAKDNWFMLTLKTIGSFFANLFSTIFETIKGWFFVVKF